MSNLPGNWAVITPLIFWAIIFSADLWFYYRLKYTGTYDESQLWKPDSKDISA